MTLKGPLSVHSLSHLELSAEVRPQRGLLGEQAGFGT